MRMRFKPYAAAELAASTFYVPQPRQWLNTWHSRFGKKQPLHIEMGCGKGGFLSKLGAKNPQINYIGIDMTDKVLILTKRNIDKEYALKNASTDNVRILTHNIERIQLMIGKEDVADRIYINFCNPWSEKSHHQKHRLTHPRQLLLYREFLKDGGEIYFKCDHDQLFEDSVDYFTQAGFEITYITRDLHADEPEWNIRTEHEMMFSEEGIPIKALIAKKVFLSPDYKAPRD